MKKKEEYKIEKEHVLFVLFVQDNGEETWLEAETTDNSDEFAQKALSENMYMKYIEWERLGVTFRLIKNNYYRMEGYN